MRLDLLCGVSSALLCSEGTQSISFAVYVVFGAAGAVGGELVSRLAQQEGAAIIASDRDQSDLENVKSATEILPADAQDEAAVHLTILAGAWLCMHNGMQ
jgi:nucleoside-diphosphate-sugar epimerase